MHLIKRLMKTVKFNLLYILAIMVLVCISRFFSIGLATGESMLPTIHSPAFLFIRKDCREYKRNEIVVCKWNHITITKRIIGLPGECITITDDGKIFIDAKQYQDIYGYAETEMFLNGDRNYPVTLATDE